MTTVLMCQQGIPFRLSPARIQMVDELIKRGSKVVLFFPGRVRETELKKKVKAVVDTSKMEAAAIRRQVREYKPDIVICFTQEDTQICFSLPYIMKNTTFYYYNLEIYVKSIKLKSANICSRFINRIDYLQNKLKEIIYVKGCEGIVIQDKLRKRILRKYGISHSRTWLIPNSYYRNEKEYHVSHKTGLIYSGTVGANFLGTFIEQVDDLEDIEITISGWYLTNRKLIHSPNIKFIKHNFSQEQYTEFISAYDIALLWYSDQSDDNVYNIGLASGKYFKHLSLGQPVISNRVPGLAEEIEKYKVGIVIDNVKELKAAVQKITENYDFYTENIKRVYDRKYDYGRASQIFFDYIIAKVREDKKANS
ncbi:MAG: glycosyltransferase family 4 protein [Lachnospiraceae bacterium]|nr:glycosyltransferase family 4 protein [Lachnospiraceae bacterium]